MTQDDPRNKNISSKCRNGLALVALVAVVVLVALVVFALVAWVIFACLGILLFAQSMTLALVSLSSAINKRQQVDTRFLKRYLGRNKWLTSRILSQLNLFKNLKNMPMITTLVVDDLVRFTAGNLKSTVDNSLWLKIFLKMKP